jgi:hypothetical protein
MKDEEQFAFGETPLPPPPAPNGPRRNRSTAVIIGLVIVGLVIAGVIVAIATSQDPSGTDTAAKPSEAPTETMEVSTPSVSPSPTPGVETFVAQFTGEVEANSGRSVDYTIIEHAKVKRTGEDIGPMILFVWDDDRGVNTFKVIQRTLRPWYETLALDYGSYGVGIPLKSQGKMWVFGIDIDDYENVPGPRGDDYIDLLLLELEKVGDLTPAGVEVS